MTEVSELWTPEEAAPKVRRTPYWLKDKARKGKIPFHRIGTTILFTPADVAEIIENGAVPAGANAARPSRSRRKPAAKVTQLRAKPVSRRGAA